MSIGIHNYSVLNILIYSNPFCLSTQLKFTKLLISMVTLSDQNVSKPQISWKYKTKWKTQSFTYFGQWTLVAVECNFFVLFVCVNKNKTRSWQNMQAYFFLQNLISTKISLLWSCTWQFCHAHCSKQFKYDLLGNNIYPFISSSNRSCRIKKHN